MNDIDFLPSRFRESRIKRQARVWGLSLIVAFGGVIIAAFLGQRVVRYQADHELREVEQDYLQAQAAQQMLVQIEGDVRRVAVEAELHTFLKHPWPRTQILRRVTTPLPTAVTLERLRIGREEAKQAQALLPGVIAPTETAAAKPVASGTPAERDLKQLRETCDARRMIVELVGYTTDLTSLHIYLNALANDKCFSQAELTSIQSVERATERRSQFTARLVIAPGYGQRGGPDPESIPVDGLQADAAPQADPEMKERS